MDRRDDPPVLTAVESVSMIRPRMADPRRDPMADDETTDEDLEAESVDEDFSEPDELVEEPDELADDIE